MISGRFHGNLGKLRCHSNMIVNRNSCFVFFEISPVVPGPIEESSGAFVAHFGNFRGPCHVMRRGSEEEQEEEKEEEEERLWMREGQVEPTIDGGTIDGGRWRGVGRERCSRCRQDVPGRYLETVEGAREQFF